MAKAIAKKRSSTALNSLVRWGFLVSLVLGVLANISFVIISGFGREVRIAGTVRDESGNPVPFAVVDLGGNKGRGITDDYGQFEINVPASRTVKQYRITISADGFSRTNLSIQGPRPVDQVDVQLARPLFTAADFANVEPTATVRHYLGNPDVVLTIDFANPLAHKISLDELSLTLTDPSGRIIPLAFEGMILPNGMLLPSFVPTLPLDKSQKWTLACSFCNHDDGIVVEQSKTLAEVPLLKKMPSPDEEIYSTELASELAAFMKGRMIWKAGDWKGALNWSIDGKRYVHEFQFSLSEGAVTQMVGIAKYYGTGFGVLPAVAFSQIREANPTVAVSLRHQEMLQK